MTTPQSNSSTDDAMAGRAIIQHTKLLINNEWVAGRGALALVNPSTGGPLCEVAGAEASDVSRAVDAAHAAFYGRDSAWRKMTGADRGVLLNRLADLVVRDRDILADLEAVNNGKVVSDAKGDLGDVVECLRYFAGWADKIHGSYAQVKPNFSTTTVREPVGVCGAIVPWNYPALMATWKLAPALAAGNTIVLKPSELTPLTALHLGALAVEAGFPAGVVNIVPGLGAEAGEALSRHPLVDKVAFTGSGRAGRLVMQASAETNLKRVSLELGGKSPVIVAADADLDQAAIGVFGALFANMGQNCCAGSRVLVHNSIYDDFVGRMKMIVENQLTGDCFDEAATYFPLVSQAQLDKTLQYIEAGKASGATLVCGGARIDRPGFFVEPTVFSHVDDSASIACEEIFGPVMSILKPFDTIDEAIDRANGTEFGLAAGVFTTNHATARKVTTQVRAGTVWVNTYNSVGSHTPFGGVKQSGFGRDLGAAALDEYTVLKTVTEKF